MSASHITDSEWAALTASAVPRGTWVYRDVSSTELAAARERGGATVDGRRFTYVQATDELIRDDVLAAVAAIRAGLPVPKRQRGKPVASIEDGES